MSGSEIKCLICHGSPEDKTGAYTDGRVFICKPCGDKIIAPMRAMGGMDWGKPEGDISVTGDYAPAGTALSFPAEIVAVIPVEIAVNVLTKALKDDPDYRQTYKANIMMCIKDAYESRFEIQDEDVLVDEMADLAADKFLDLFIGGKGQ